MYLHTPALEVGSWWRIDTASGSDTATTVYAHDGTDAIPTSLGVSGSTVRNTRVDGTALFWSSAATLYCKELTYQGVPNGTVVTSTGSTPTTPGGAGTGGPVLGGPNVWAGTQDFTGATVTGAGGGGAATLLDRGNWATSTLYAVGDVTTQAGQRYAARVAHTSGTFATDLAATKWVSLDAVAAAVSSRTITAGTGLTGGGDLTADRTLTVAYGTTSGTAAQGNDSRITGAIASGAAAGGDLSGTLPSPTVAKINGVAVTGTPTSGQVPTATSGSAATWQTPGDRLGLTPTAVKTSAYAAAAGDFVPVDTTGGAVTVTFPTAPTDGTIIAVKHVIQGGTNAVTVALGGSDKFNTTTGGTTRTLTLVSQALLAQYKSSTAVWYIVADDLPLSGLDARYAQLSNNLSDVTAASARTNLGLGSAALISSTAGGDLSGTLPSPTVAKVNGVAVTGTPSSGQVPTATGASAATWQTPAGAPQVLYTGGWYGPAGGSNGTTQYSADGVLHASPIFIGATVTLQTIGTNIGTGGSAGSVVRLGIYAATSAGNPIPGALVVDAGTVSTTASGDKTLTISNVLSPGLYWLVSASQGGAATQPIQRNIQTAAMMNSIPTLGAAGPVGTSALGYTFTGYTTTLPGTFSTAGQAAAGPVCAVYIRAA